MGKLEFDSDNHQFKIDGRPIPSVTQIIKGAGLIDDRWFDDYYSERGSAVHLTCQLFDEGDLDEANLDPVLSGYLSGWKKFRSDTGFTPDEIEKQVYNLELQYAGMLDRFGVLAGVPTIIDIKSGAVPWWVGIQLAGYAGTFPAGKKLRRMAVKISQDGTYKVVEFIDRNEWKFFKNCLEIEHLKRRMKNES
jgi:hypothetical protein